MRAPSNDHTKRQKSSKIHWDVQYKINILLKATNLFLNNCMHLYFLKEDLYCAICRYSSPDLGSAFSLDLFPLYQSYKGNFRRISDSHLSNIFQSRTWKSASTFSKRHLTDRHKIDLTRLWTSVSKLTVTLNASNIQCLWNVQVVCKLLSKVNALVPLCCHVTSLLD